MSASNKFQVVVLKHKSIPICSIIQILNKRLNNKFRGLSNGFQFIDQLDS